MAETTHKAKLVGFDNFVRSNPKSDRFDVHRFHHVEFISGDAITTAARFSAALGMPFIARSNQMSGNQHYASHVIRSGSACIAFTSPYNSGAAPPPTDGEWDPSKCPNPTVTGEKMREQFGEHGLFVGAVCIQVADAAVAHDRAVAGGATSRAAPRSAPGIDYTVAEVTMYNGSDAVLRFISGSALDDDSMPFLPGYVAAGKPDAPTFGIQRMDHIVGNVPDLLSNVDHMIAATGFHEFAEFTAEDVGTVDSGLNSMVLASNNEAVLLPMNEPTTGGKRKSQILTYLEQNRGPGVQHIALKTDDIFATVAKMREAAGGFELMERPREQYFDNLDAKLGPGTLSKEEIEKCRSLGILADADDRGVLLQIFTKPVGDRATFFFEIIQRVGCMADDAGNKLAEQTPGCGGFGKGNFSELFRAIEEYETKSGINKI